MANNLTQSAIRNRNMSIAGIPDNIIQQANTIGRDLSIPGGQDSVTFNLTASYKQGTVAYTAQQLAKAIISMGGQAYGASERDAINGNITFNEFASIAKQYANSKWTVDSTGIPYPLQSATCAEYVRSLYGTGLFGLGRRGIDKKAAELDTAVKKLDLTTLSDGTSAASSLDTLLKMCYEGIQNVPQDVSQKINNALGIVAQNVQKDNQTPDKRYVSGFVGWCVKNPNSYTMAWLKQSFPNPAQTFKSALTNVRTQAAVDTAANAVKTK